MRHTRKVSDPIKPRTPPTFELFIPFQNHKIKKFSPALFYFIFSFCGGLHQIKIIASVPWMKEKKSLNRLLQDTSYVEESQLFFNHISKCKNFFLFFFSTYTKEDNKQKKKVEMFLFYVHNPIEMWNQRRTEWGGSSAKVRKLKT